MTIYGRGGQGGVTLAKMIATAWFLRGKYAQAFGVYAAERSGAPIQAYVRIDDEEITNTNQIRKPDHVIVLDPTLIGESILAGMPEGGCVILNASKTAESWEAFRGRRLAAVDATSIAVRHGLGTASVPIVNTTMMGAVAQVFGFTFDELRGVFAQLGFGGANIDAAREAFDSVTIAELEGDAHLVSPARNSSPVSSLFDPSAGRPPAIRTGAWATRRPQRRVLTPPCNAVCPAGNDVQSFLAAAAHGDYDRALDILLETTPFPGVCGRVCPAPCMSNCNRRDLDEGVNVRDVERFIADHATWKLPRKVAETNHRIAIVGSGPAGMSAAYQLARRGHHVSLFESSDELGGVLRNGIPDYRLPKEILDREVGHVLMHGVNAYVDSPIQPNALDDLKNHYDAVFVATGLQSPRSLALGSSAIQGIEFLDRVHRNDVSVRGRQVVVAGGGNTAIDAARSAVRLGAASVSIVYRRTVFDMPAIADEVDAALEEGVLLHELALPERLEKGLLHCVRMIATGRGKLIADTSPGSHFAIPCDDLILALGQEADRALAGRDGIWYGGDFETNEGTVAAAIGSGRRAAQSIHAALTGATLSQDEEPRRATVDDLHLHLFTRSPRNSASQLEPPMRAATFAEVHGEIDDASDEAKRCLSCGVCNTCDRCRDHCPDGSLRREGDEYFFNYDYCKGCGVCATECPRGAVVMIEI